MHSSRKVLDYFFFRLKAFKGRSVVKRGSRVIVDRSAKFDRRCFFSARGGSIVIERNSFMNMEVILNADIGGAIHISEGCIIGPRVIFRTANHRFESLSDMKIQQGHDFGDIVLEKNVWIGANVTILPNVTIGENSVIGAGAVVTKDIPRNSLAVGVPAAVKRELNNN